MNRRRAHDMHGGSTRDARAARKAAYNRRFAANEEYQRRQDGQGGGSGGAPQWGGPSQAEYDKLKSDFDKYKGGEADRNKKAAEDRLKAYQGEKRQKLTDEYGGYKGEYKDLGKESKDLTEDLVKMSLS